MIQIALEKPYQQKPKLCMWRWVEENVILSLRQPVARGSYGYYQTSLVPYVRGVFDAVEDPAILRVTMVKGAQLGLTLFGYCCVCYWIVTDPDPVLIAMPNARIGRSKSEQNMMPLIEDSPTVAAELTDDPDDFKKDEYILRRCAVNWIGANSPANLASRAARYLMLDETEKYPVNVKDEAGAVALAMERQKTFEEFRLLFEASTPVSEHGHIWQSYLEGNQQQFAVPCMHCGKPFTLDFKRDFKFDTKKKSLRVDEIARAAFIECVSCSRSLDNHDKEQMIDRGVWKAKAKAQDPAHASFHLPSWYAKWVSIADVVRNFLQAKDNPARLQNFVNSTQALPWRAPPKRSLAAAKIRELQKRFIFARGVVPTSDECVLVATTDVQASHLVFHVYAMTLREHYLIDSGFLAVMDDIEGELMPRSYFDDEKREHKIKRLLLDTGYDTVRAYGFALAHPYVMPIKGEKGAKTRMTKPVAPSSIDSFPNGKLFGGTRSLTLMHLHPSFFKDQLSFAISGRADDDADEQTVEGSIDAASEVAIFFHKEIDDEFVKQITGEVLRETKPDKYGNADQYWEVVRRPQDDFDCAQYSFAARHLAHNTLLKLDQLTLQRRDAKESAQEADAAEPETQEKQSSAVGLFDDSGVDPNSIALS